MRSRQSSLEALAKVAEGLGSMCQDVAFVGGITLALYIDDPAAPDVRITEDVDCVVEATSRLEMSEVEAKLRNRGFQHHPDSQVICRWLLHKTIIVDVMPSVEGTYGFTNRWYADGLQRKEERVLVDGRAIFVFPFPYFFASKLEALAQRGGNAWDSSKDFEDIVSVLDGRQGALEQLLSAPADLRTYLRNEARCLLRHPNKLREAVSAHLLPEKAFQDRAPTIYAAFWELAAPRTPEMMLAEMGVPDARWPAMKIALKKVLPMGSATASVAIKVARDLAEMPRYAIEVTWRERASSRRDHYDNAMLLTPQECSQWRAWLLARGQTFQDVTGMSD